MDKPEIDPKTGLWKDPQPHEHSDYYYDYTRNDPNAKNPFTDPKDRERAEFVVGAGNTAAEIIDRYCIDGLDYEVDYMSSSADYMSDIDDQYAHYYTPYQMADRMDYEPKRAHYYKYHEEEILKDIEEYVSGTYQGHYTGNSHEFRKVQTIDLMASKDLASGFCQANILKYGSRYGNKDGRNQKDLLKVIHYAMLLLHFDGHYSKPPMTTGNIDINMP